MSNDKTHAEMVAAVASNYAKEACAATQGVIEAVKTRKHAPGIGTCADCGQSLSACECPDKLYEAAFNQEPCARCEDERGDCGGHFVSPTGPVYSETPETRARIEAILAENYKLVAKVSELQVAIEFLRSQKPVPK